MEAQISSANSITPTPAAFNNVGVGEMQKSNSKEGDVNDSIFQSVFYQPKLTIGSPDDPLEKEADDMADRVMRMSMPDPFMSSRGGAIQRKCSHCEKEEQLHRKESGADSVSVAPSIVHNVLNSGGRSMDNETRSFMEPRFNYDFSNVKIHDNNLAAKSASSINALAYTSGNNVVFNSGQYNTSSDSGKRLLAHELTHVVQQDHATVKRQEGGVTADDNLSGIQPAQFIVEDDTEPGEGQMRKSEFLERLNTEICATVDATMQGTTFSSDNCPYIRASFARHYNSSPLQIQQLLQRYAPASTFAQSIEEVTEAVKSRVAVAALQWLQNGGNLSEMTDEASSLVPVDGEENSGGIFLKENSSGGQASDSPASVMNSLGRGSPLDGSTRSNMESAFGTSFSDVEIHTDSHASSLSSGMNARAFTVGKHIAFSNGEHQPGSLIGDALMAHELAHVVQQKNVNTNELQYKNETTYGQLEEDADTSAINAIGMMKGIKGNLSDLGKNVMPKLKSGLRLSRCPKKDCDVKRKKERPSIALRRTDTPRCPYVDIKGSAPGATTVDLHYFEGDTENCNITGALVDDPLLILPVINDDFAGQIPIGEGSLAPGVGKKVIAVAKDANNQIIVGSVSCGVVTR